MTEINDHRTANQGNTEEGINLLDSPKVPECCSRNRPRRKNGGYSIL